RWLDQVWETSTPGSRLEFKFRGTHAKIYDVPVTNGGQIFVTVDGVKTGPFPRVHTPWWSRLYAFPVAMDVDPEKVHTVVIELDSAVPEKQKDPSVKPEFYDGIRWLAGQIMTDGEVVE
nr:SGNH/GDSL hydrolase family protein [Thermoguttaceae bacterium]